MTYLEAVACSQNIPGIKVSGCYCLVKHRSAMDDIISTKESESPRLPALPPIRFKPQPHLFTEKVAPYPFDDKSADLVLRSSDKVHFYVYKAILSYASGFFRDLFSLGQSPVEDTKPDSAPILDIAEHSVTLEQVLLWCYPVSHSEPKTLSTVRSILAVAVKYDMTGVVSHMHRPLSDLRTVLPSQVFSIACTHCFSDIAADAAEVLKGKYGNRATTQDTEWHDTIPYAIYTQEISSIRAASFLRLLHFVRDGTKPSDFCRPSQSEIASESEVYWPVRIDHPDGDLVIRSQLDLSIDFRVHRQIIAFSSPVLKAMIQTDCIHTTNVSEGSDELPLLELPEGSTILGLLLRSCYPSDGLDSSNFDPSYIPLFAEAGKKYGVERAITFCRERLAELTFKEPFRAYYLAIRCDWKMEAREAAVHLSQLCAEDEYHSSMENLDTEFYYPLLRFCHEYRMKLSSIRSKFSSRNVTYQNLPTVSQAFARCRELYTGEDIRSFLDTAIVISLMPPSNNSHYAAVGPIERVQNVYKEIAEQLSSVSLSILIVWRLCLTVS